MQLTADNYFSAEAGQQFMSASQFKSFQRCEASALAELNGEQTRTVSPAMLAGSYLDAMVSGEQEQFEADHPELRKKSGDLYAAYERIPYLYERIMRDPLFREYLQGDTQTILTGTIEGVPVKAKLDILHPERIVDLKTTANFRQQYSPHHSQYVTFGEYWRYDIQGAIYQELVLQSTGRKLPFYLAAVTTEDEPDIAVLEIPQDVLDAALDEVKLSIGRYQAIKLGFEDPMRCERCSYCRRTKQLTAPLDYRELYAWET